MGKWVLPFRHHRDGCGPYSTWGGDTDVREEDDAAQAFMDLEVGIVGLVEAFEERWGEGGA